MIKQKFKLLFICFLISSFFAVNFSVKAFDFSISERLSGKILLQVEKNGEAWYVNPADKLRYFLGRPSDAFSVMRELGVGIIDKDLVKIEIGNLNDTPRRGASTDSDNDGYSDYDELLNGYNPYGHGSFEIDPYFSSINIGKIFLQVEQNGEAWYVNQADAKRYFLGRPQDAFSVMRSLGLGITNNDLEEIVVACGERCPTPGSPGVGHLNGDALILHDVPFTPQAPFGNWADQRQEDACEESSVLMAMKWINGRSLTYDEALEEILAISDFEKEKYGYFNDTSAQDTMDRIFKDYYSYESVKVLEDIKSEDIVIELKRGNLVIVPVDGRKLGNPYFTQPGPERHMLLIKGFDGETNEFITNEPGTKRGENYRYKSSVMENAIRDYPSGLHLPIIGEKKAMIVVSR